jgi:hypothetical protein
MTTFSAKSSSGRTEWQLIDGRLKETGPDSFTFTLTATDTFELLKLLFKGKNEVLQALQKERASENKEKIAVDFEGELQEHGTKSGATSSITLDDGLRGAGMKTTINPKNAERGA